MPTDGFLEELRWRGLLYQCTDEVELGRHLAGGRRAAYCGFDPTADSLTIGNLIPIKLLIHWQRAGHKPVVVMGGGTGLIGDPSGKDSERPLLSEEQVEANIADQRRILERLLDFEQKNPCGAEIVNNADWLRDLGYIEVLREVGKHFPVSSMMQRDSVRSRLGDRARGMSYTEFSYMVLQAYDFLELRRTRNCAVQLAGADQYGNIVAGIELIRRTLGPEVARVFGVTAPLLTHADGRKIGKSEEGAVWLSADRTSPYTFYQYWINVPDTDVHSFLRWFSLMSKEEIDGLVVEHARLPAERRPQRALAGHMTDLLHGVEERLNVERASDALFSGGDPRVVSAHMLSQVVADLPHTQHGSDDLSGQGISLVELLPQTTLANSRREARQFLRSGAIAVNGVRVDIERRLGEKDLLAGGYVLLRRGKKTWHATHWING